MQTIKTYSPNNQFCFNCPIFGVETKISSCLALREETYKGRKPEVRKGCQVAMRDGKCPVLVVVNDIFRLGADADSYYSADHKVGSIHADVIGRIAPVQVQTRTIDQFGVSDRERELLLASNDMKGSRQPVASKAVIRKSAAVELDDVPLKSSVSKPSKAESDTLAAAQTGDMSAAINAALKGPAKPTASVSLAPAVSQPAIEKSAPEPVSAPAKRPSLLELARQKGAA